jgi:hypothetical protein
MSAKEFRALRQVFFTAAQVVKNDEGLAKWLIDLGAEIVALGYQEAKREQLNLVEAGGRR